MLVCSGCARHRYGVDGLQSALKRDAPLNTRGGLQNYESIYTVGSVGVGVGRTTVIEELHTQIDTTRRELELAEQGGRTYEASLRRARLEDLLEIAARHAIRLTAPMTPRHAPNARTDPRRAPSRRGAPVYTRVNTIFGPQDRVDAGVAQIEGPDRAAVEATSGNRGLMTMVDRKAAVIVAISYWDEPDRSSDAELTRARQNAVVAAGGDLVAENYVLAFDERESIPAPGAAVRLVRVQIASARSDDGLTYLWEEILPQLRASAGFHHAEVMVDQNLGRAVLVTTWRDADHATRADAILDRVRTDALHRARVTLPATETYTLVRDAADTRVTGRT